VRVVGISEPVRLYELLDTMENAVPPQIKLVGVFHESLSLFENWNWKQAAEGFREALAIKAGDKPAQKYFERCMDFIKTPPPDTWDGVYNLTEK
jgi:adenylate cyclase